MRKVAILFLFTLLVSPGRSDVILSNLGWTSNGGVTLGTGLSNSIVIQNFGEDVLRFDAITVRLFNDAAATNNITGLSFNIGANTYTGTAAGTGIAAGQYGNISVNILGANLLSTPFSIDGQSQFNLTNVQGLGGIAQWAYAFEGLNTFDTNGSSFNYTSQTLENRAGGGSYPGIPPQSLAQFSISAVAVPEPGTLMLGGFASLAGICSYWVRRKRFN